MTKDIDTIKLSGSGPVKANRSIWDGEFVDILSKYRYSDEMGKNSDDIGSNIKNAKDTQSASSIKSAEVDLESKLTDMPKNVISAMEALQRLKSSTLGESPQVTGEMGFKSDDLEDIKTVDKDFKMDISKTENPTAYKESIEGDGLSRLNQDSIEKVKQRYMVGKIVGENIVDNRGVLIVSRHEVITMDIIDRVEKAGKIVELVINMQFPD